MSSELTLPQKNALAVLSEFPRLLKTPRGYGWVGAPPAVQACTADVLLKRGYARLVILAGNLSYLRVTENGRAVLARQIKHEQERASARAKPENEFARRYYAARKYGL